ncbi:prepilin peptidase [Pasteuria penetrans]|uniref:prepilin peptidase n=1 Tax=Pasteuria penetrans TaxID=86005 RepID=UPI000F94738C|nr:prepilin peptidase [Pasteuria penetrans]
MVEGVPVFPLSILLPMGFLGIILASIWVRIICWWMDRQGFAISISRYWWSIPLCALGVVALFVSVTGGEILGGLLLLYFLIFLSITDLCCYWVPDLFTYSGIVLFGILRFFVHVDPFSHYFIAAIVAGSTTTLLALSGSMGWGDVKLSIALGWMVGVEGFFLALLLAVYGTLWFFVLRIWMGKPWHPLRPFPFVPSLSIGGFVAYFLQSGLSLTVL